MRFHEISIALSSGHMNFFSGKDELHWRKKERLALDSINGVETFVIFKK